MMCAGIVLSECVTEARILSDMFCGEFGAIVLFSVMV